ncbi:MAG: hypothetical protein ACOWWO_09180 [Peptococcaceae bacterium]
MRPIIIGIAGTAKNTGKTTTTGAIMREIREDGAGILGLTSIGYDGEDLDNVTGLPKPKIEVWPGIIVAVAEKCLKVSTAQLEVLERTNISTPLGEVLIGRVKKSGRLLVAGPNKSRELGQVISLMKNYNCSFIIVDGALNRIAPMVEVDGIILATGAARTTDLEKLALETGIIDEVLKAPVYERDRDAVTMTSVLDLTAAKELVCNLEKHEQVFIKGIVTSQGLEYLLDESSLLQGKTLLYADPIKLLLSMDTNKMAELLDGIKASGLRVGVRKPVKLLAVTINPYYPQFRFTSDDYQAAYVDKLKLYEMIKTSVAAPVYNVMEQGGRELYKNILKTVGG